MEMLSSMVECGRKKLKKIKTIEYIWKKETLDTLIKTDKIIDPDRSQESWVNPIKFYNLNEIRTSRKM